MNSRAVERRYALESMLGEGLAAQVYRAKDLRTKRRVAVKLYRDSGPTLGHDVDPLSHLFFSLTFIYICYIMD